MRRPILLVAAFAASAVAQQQQAPLNFPLPQGAYRIGDGVSAPTILSKVEPGYSEEARAAKSQGTVVLSLVVDEQGRPQNLKVLRSLGLGLDEKSIEAVAQWRFKPGMKDGKPVPVAATIEVNFRLLDGPEDFGQGKASPIVSGPFNPTGQMLGPNFAGQDVEAVVRAIQESDAARPKSEFETTAQYESRRDAARMDGRQFVFVLGGPDGDALPGYSAKFTYDADHQMMMASIPAPKRTFLLETSAGSPNGHPSAYIVDLRRVRRSSDQYVGSNAFGAQILVNRSYSDEYGLVLANTNGLFEPNSDGLYSSDYQSLLLLPISAESARDLKPNLRIGLVCRIQQTRIVRDIAGLTPTVSSPFEAIINRQYLPVLPTEVFLFDTRSGVILARLRTDASVSSFQDDETQRALRQKMFPIELEIIGTGNPELRIDGADRTVGSFVSVSNGSALRRAQHQIYIKVTREEDLKSLSFKLNGQPWTPAWRKIGNSIGNFTMFSYADTLINATLAEPNFIAPAPARQ